jgi:hypothetical protein
MESSTTYNNFLPLLLSLHNMTREKKREVRQGKKAAAAAFDTANELRMRMRRSRSGGRMKRIKILYVGVMTLQNARPLQQLRNCSTVAL